ncbi:MAG: hypothetical protein ACYDBV_10105 [Nitrospiria bacterium]
MKHVLYVFYVTFYASAVFLAGLFAGQIVERKNARKNEGHSRSNRALDQLKGGTETMVKSNFKT